jgi:hypothetical protein
MVRDFGNRRDVRSRALNDQLVGALKIGADEVDETVEAGVFFFFERNNDAHRASSAVLY